MEGKEDKQSHDSDSIFLPPETSPVLVSGEINFGGSTVAPAPPPTASSDGFKKKRGRPRKYGPDGKPLATLSPMPISASIPLTGDYPGWKHSQVKPSTSIKRKQKLEFCTPGEQVVNSVGANFAPHVLTVKSGEDVNMKIISFAQKEARATCVLAANGAISNVTLRQHTRVGLTLFVYLELRVEFNGGTKGMSGGMRVSLAGPDGRVLGGGLAGMLVAAGPIQVILGSFLPNHQHEQHKLKKSRFEPVGPIFKETSERAYVDEPNNIGFTLTNPIHVSRDLNLENNNNKNNNGSLDGPESKVINTSQFEVSC